MLHTIIFIGRSGCGKGTQADLLQSYIAGNDKESRRILSVETGERFRQFIKGDTYSSSLSNEVYKNDLRQPDFLACFMWGKVLIEELGKDTHLIFDGTSRSLLEASILSTALQFYQRENPKVIYLKVSRKWSEEKLLARGRSDDKTLTDIDKRLDWFDRDTLPAIEYFRNNQFYKLLEINGEQSKEKVHSDIVAAYGNSS